MTQRYYNCYKKVIAEQPTRIIDAVEYDVKPESRIRFSHLAALGLGIFLGMIVITGIKSCHNPPVPLRDCSSCHNKFTTYFQRKGSKTPEEMAFAVLQTKSPKLLAAIAVVESSGNPTIRNSGYKRRHHGAFQVNPRYHGTVSHNAVEQALQSERILEELTQERKNVRTALNAYGGDSQGHYANKILAELQRVP